MLYATAGPLWLRIKKKDYTMKIIKETNCITGNVTLTYTVEDGTEMYAFISGDTVQDAADAVVELEQDLVNECLART
jgi:transketolase C-terminal domain/subunit